MILVEYVDVDLFFKYQRYTTLDEIKGNIISISEKMKIPSDGCWGFDDSEALLSMIRIPNNTLSLLWKGEPKENVPFPRC